MKKRMFIDLTSLCRKHTGIENYTQNLVLELLENENEYEYFLLFRNAIASTFEKYKKNPNIHLHLSSLKSQLLTEQIFIPLFLFKNKFDLCFFPCFPPGFFVNGNLIIMVYDATMWKFKDTVSLKNKLYFKPLSELAIKKATFLFTISESSKEGIIQYFPKIKNRLFNINAAISEEFNIISLEDSADAIKKMGIKKKYLLCVSSLEPRKNIPFIIKNISSTLKEYDLELVLAGREAWGNNEINDEIEKNKLEDRVIKTGYISNLELQCLYSNAEIFLYPSIYEGFGLPILEAFTCECPVITSNVSSMPNVAGDAAILINPTDSNELIVAIKSILDSKENKKVLIEKGKKQKECFSWKKSATLFWTYLTNDK